MQTNYLTRIFKNAKIYNKFKIFQTKINKQSKQKQFLKSKNNKIYNNKIGQNLKCTKQKIWIRKWKEFLQMKKWENAQNGLSAENFCDGNKNRKMGIWQINR